ncbi:hypothetical protein [Delftia sp. PS-11]|uniref:hypothetical protein n=1 Tax=Delftia sp. PS-11 TaxID=2767222 RepID=UPI00245756D5|nr:hypothetical protein [Delftia sp. PS-11]KAJ8745435.1 hypothetical protein H9T68_06445 [Delftia sp. PS-11]
MSQKKEQIPAVQTSAQTVLAESGKPAKLEHHEATKLPAPDEFHGRAGRYVRDPATGVRALRKD